MYSTFQSCVSEPPWTTVDTEAFYIWRDVAALLWSSTCPFGSSECSGSAPCRACKSATFHALLAHLYAASVRAAVRVRRPIEKRDKGPRVVAVFLEDIQRHAPPFSRRLFAEPLEASAG